MGSISVSGTGCAARISASRRRAGIARPLLCAAVLPLTLGNSLPTSSALAPHPASPATGSLEVAVSNLRSKRGVIRACLTANPRHFPKCDHDPNALTASVAAGQDTMLQFTGLTAGDYALSILHDENDNARVDMLLGIPREGVGFSQNPALHFGPPSFRAARFHVGTGNVTEQVRMKYFL